MNTQTYQNLGGELATKKAHKQSNNHSLKTTPVYAYTEVYLYM